MFSIVTPRPVTLIFSSVTTAAFVPFSFTSIADFCFISEIHIWSEGFKFTRFLKSACSISKAESIVRAIQTLNKVDKVVDDVNDKVQTLNGFFNLVDFATDKVVSITDKVVDGVSGLIGNIFKKKNKDEDEER